MNQAIKHRGPDGEGFCFFTDSKAVPVYSPDTPMLNRNTVSYTYNASTSLEEIGKGYHIAFGHRRLSVIDLSEAGHQPMCDQTSNYWITFNGEIYNYVELREELKAKAHLFYTQTDTEVIIEAYKEWGIQCIQKFNGMFAFTLLDRIKNQIYCVRDRAGVKPLYFIDTPENFAFASEYKAFIKAGLIPFEINRNQQFDFIVNGNLENGEESLFRGIKELKPAHYLKYDLGTHGFTISKYYDLPGIGRYNEEEDATIIQKVEHKLVEAIRLRLRSDVEIGSCLSGGLDSSIIAGIVKSLQPHKQIKLFTAVFPGEPFDESLYAQQVSKLVGGSWNTVSPSAEEFFRDIEQLNYSQDLPVWSTSTYSQYRVMKLAAHNHVKVVLDGQGADELFAGYAHHFMTLWKEHPGFHTLQRIKEADGSVPSALILFGKQLLKDAFGISYNYSRYFKEEFRDQEKGRNEKLANSLNEQLQQDFSGRLKSYLKCEDRCSMAFGIESRVPFADDTALLNYIFSIEGNKKIQKGISKYLLREATKAYIPISIYKRRDKIGFETPVRKWFAPNKRHVLETIQQLDFVNMDTLNAHFDSLLIKKPAFILRLYSLAIWTKVFRAV
jgi:asparagine synthase (glutamine-hydrolysing)